MFDYNIWLKERDEYEKQIAEVIKKVDSSLEFFEILYPSSTCVCRVTRKNKFFIFKIAEGRMPLSHWNLWDKEQNTEETFQWEIDHLKKEKRLLITASEISGITHLVQSYEDLNENYVCPILKEFCYGQNLWESRKKISDKNIQQKLEKTICELHDLGLVHLDIKSNNVILSSKDDAKIIEIGGAYYKEELEESEYKKEMAEDFRRLKEYVFE